MTNEAIDNLKNDHRIGMQVLNEIDVYDVLRQIFPPKNDVFKTDYIEELNELLYFGIDTKVKLIDLLAKHQVAVIEIDEEELDEAHINFYKQDYDEEMAFKVFHKCKRLVLARAFCMIINNSIYNTCTPSFLYTFPSFITNTTFPIT